jgi:hypothetical protein
MRFECKQVVEGCRLDIDSGVQLIELRRGNWLRRDLEARLAWHFSVDPALSRGAESLHGPARFKPHCPWAGVGDASRDNQGVGNDLHRNLHSKKWTSGVGMAHLNNHDVVGHGENEWVVLKSL